METSDSTTQIVRTSYLVPRSATVPIKCSNFYASSLGAGDVNATQITGQTVNSTALTCASLVVANLNHQDLARRITKADVALLKWYDTGALYSLPAVDTVIPTINGLCFDGRYIWAAVNSDRLFKIEAGSGEILGVYPSKQGGAVNAGPMCFDGTYLWVLHTGIVISIIETGQWTADAGSVSKIDPVTGAVIGTFSSGGKGGSGICVGHNGDIYIANNGDSFTAPNVVHMNPSNGVIYNTISLTVPADLPARFNICFDGTYVWVSSDPDASVTRIASNQTKNKSGVLPANPQSMCFDGTYLWLTSSTGAVVKLNRTTFDIVGTYAVGTQPYALLYDGSYICAATAGTTSVTQVQPSTGAVYRTRTIAIASRLLVYDGENFWGAVDNVVAKIRPSGQPLATWVVV